MKMRATLTTVTAGGSVLLPESAALQILNWLDWEETSLRASVQSADAVTIQQAVQHLQSALGSSTYLVGDKLTLADVVIFVSLFPIQV